MASFLPAATSYFSFLSDRPSFNSGRQLFEPTETVRRWASPTERWPRRPVGSGSREIRGEDARAQGAGRVA